MIFVCCHFYLIFEVLGGFASTFAHRSAPLQLSEFQVIYHCILLFIYMFELDEYPLNLRIFMVIRNHTFSTYKQYYDCSNILDVKSSLYCLSDGAPSALQDAFLNRLAQADATESSCTYKSSNQMEEDKGATCEKTKNIVCNVVAAIDNQWRVKDAVYDALVKELPEDGESLD